MPRSILRLLCLVAALTGNPLRQAEAAEDFAHSLGEIGQPYSIEEKDGGVGDDSGSSILRDVHHIDIAVADLVHLPGPVLVEVPSAGADRPEVAVWRGVATAAGRCAWLQRFLF